MWQRPVVHSGFLRCWLEDGLNQRVVQHVLALAAAWEAAHPGQAVPVLVTGVLARNCHSLMLTRDAWATLLPTGC